MPAIVFDLDETLLDTSMLRDARAAHRFAEVSRRLDEVKAYENQHSDAQAAELPARVRALGDAAPA